MSNRLSPVPAGVTASVIEFVRKARLDAEKYDNVEPLDDGHVYSLHRLAADIYAAGWDDGHRSGQLETRPIR